MLGSCYHQCGEKVLNWFKIAPNMPLSIRELISLNNQETAEMIYTCLFIKPAEISLNISQCLVVLWGSYVLIITNGLNYWWLCNLSLSFVIGRYRKRYDVKQIKVGRHEGKRTNLMLRTKITVFSFLSFQSPSSYIPSWKERVLKSLLSNIRLFRFCNC